MPTATLADRVRPSHLRFTFIDTVRALAACAVLVQHSLEASGIETLARGRFCLSWLNLGEAGVVAFFLVSGFVIPLSLEKYDDLRQFWINRGFRIYPLYICVYVATFSLSMGSTTLMPVRKVPLNFLLNLLFVQEYVGARNFVGGSWTLSLEAVWYVGFTILYALSFNRRVWVFLAVAVSMAMAACAVSLLGMARAPLGRVDLILLCVLGLLCYRRRRGDLSGKGFAVCTSILLATVYVNLFVGFHLHPSNLGIAPSFRCVFLSWSLGLLAFFAAYFSRAAAWCSLPVILYLGRISYSVYLVHPVMLLVFSKVGLSGAPFFLSVVVFSLALASLTFRYVEKPGISFSHHLQRAGESRLVVG